MIRHDLSWRERLLARCRRFWASVWLRQRRTEYGHGEIESRDSFIESKISWIWRSFGRDRYVYTVTEVPLGPRTVHIIERVQRLSFLSQPEDGQIDGYSGIHDKHFGIQRDPFFWWNDGTYGERSTLTIYGTWIASYPINRSEHHDHAPISDPPAEHRLPPLGAPFANVPLPTEIRIFSTEQAAYSYLPNVNGEKIPPQIKHIAWVAIGVSTIAWQWHDEIGDWIVTLVDQLGG